MRDKTNDTGNYMGERLDSSICSSCNRKVTSNFSELKERLTLFKNIETFRFEYSEEDFSTFVSKKSVSGNNT